jgi:hypothetical protein
MTVQELKTMRQTWMRGFRQISRSDKDIWQKAFDEYNSDHPKDRPLGLHCLSCYRKVLAYLKNVVPEDAILLEDLSPLLHENGEYVSEEEIRTYHKYFLKV